MNFAEQLATYVGQNVQVFLTVDTVIGVLSSVNDTSAVLRVNGVPGYGTAQDVTLLLSSIAYVRIAA